MALLLRLIKKQLQLIVLSIIISILVILISLWWNSQISDLINSITEKEAFTVSFIPKLCFIIVLSSLSAYFFGVISSWTCETMAHDLRMGYGRHINSLTIIEIENINAGNYLSVLQNEITEISQYISSNLFSIVDDIIRFIITFSWILFLNPKLTILAHIPVFFIMWYIVLSSKIIERYANESQEANKKMNGAFDTLISVFPILRIYNATKLICNKYSNDLLRWETLSRKEERTRAKLMSLSGLLSCIPLLLLLLMGGSQVIHGEISLGTLYIFINLSGNVSGILMNMPGRISAFRKFAANMNRIEKNVII
jgi:ABC-type multidrug transport system fused ATPase/permease subunit